MFDEAKPQRASRDQLQAVCGGGAISRQAARGPSAFQGLLRGDQTTGTGSVRRGGGAAGQRPPGGREVQRGSQEKASAFNVSQAWSAQSQLSAVAFPGAGPTTGIPVRWFAEGGRSGSGGAGESRRTRKEQNKAVVSVRSWLLTRPTGSTSLSGGPGAELPLLSLVMAAACHVGGKGGEVGGGERQAITKGSGFHLTKDTSNQRG